MYDYFSYDPPLYRPPSEGRSQIFQITLGCSQNNCSFCGMYKTKQFAIRPVAEIAAEIELIPAAHRAQMQRVFLADGDALVYPQAGLMEILQLLNKAFPNLTRVGIYASPNSLRKKSVEELKLLRQKKLRILYFGLESGDAETLAAVKKGYTPEQMLAFCRKAQQAGLKLSVTAILGLAGRERSAEHAKATAQWVNELSPEYFSLLTMFQRHNDDFLRSITQLSNGGVIEEALQIVQHLSPQKTIMRSNHVSNVLNLAGSYPKDREKLIAQAESALAQAKLHPSWFNEVPDYSEDRF
ncbi:MAG: radical SAM protein [Desulfuromonadales bacterium]|nr:radical SAM protein [Desulfuromonadales bacterium]